MADLSPSVPTRRGERLGGRYRLDDLVGEGGMGSVWRATDEQLGRTVAVKIFAPGSAETADAARRETEKRLLAAVSHPSLVTLFDAQLTDHRPYLVMEYVDGGTLARLISRGPIRPVDVASIATDLGEALHVIHESGIIHRDVKPANVLLRPALTAEHTFRPVLADFGVAYLVDAARVTAPGTAIGTAAYISPEQVRGQDPTPASDIYSLGLVLLEALEGRRAYPQQTPVEAVAARLTAPPVVPGTWGYSWRSLLTAMTSLDPSARPTAMEVAMRGRALEPEEPDPEVTAAAIDMADSLPQNRASVTETMVLSPGDDATPAPVGPQPDSAKPSSGAEASRGRWGRIAAIAGASLVVVAGVILALSAWGGLATTPIPPPDLPQVEEPLGTHLRELMEQVSQ
jgi:serine/threonine protein kinase